MFRFGVCGRAAAALLCGLVAGAMGCGDDEAPSGAPADGGVGANDGAWSRDGAGGGGGDGGPAADSGWPPGSNRPPRFRPVPDQAVPLGFTLSFRVLASDPEGQPVVTVAAALPAGGELLPETSTFRWTPADGQQGNHVAEFEASDGEGTARLSVPIRVFSSFDPDPDPEDPERPHPPSAEGETPCGGLCCPADQLCLFNACVLPGALCETDFDCAQDEYCDPLLERCLPQGGGAGACIFMPPIGEFAPEVGCRWTPPRDHPARSRRDVVMAPVVVNVNDDNGDGRTDLDDIPEIIFTTYDLDSGCCNKPGTIRVVSGLCNADGTMNTIATIQGVNVDNSGGLAVGDLTGDGVPEIVGILIANSQPQGTIALQRTAADGSEWEELWRNPTLPRWNRHTKGGAQPALADVNADGTPDVIVGNVVLNGANGEALWDGRETGGAQAGVGNNAFLGPVSVVGDLDLDGRVEVLAGNTAYRFDGEPLWTFEFPGHNSPCGGDLRCDGYTATGNFDEDPEGEVVIVNRGMIYVLEHDGQLKASIAIPKINCGHNEAGPPTVADFDGDGRAEIGSAAADFYVVADLDCLGEPPPQGCAGPGILWKVANEDCSSRVTASSVFDFEGDGAAEVVYADETTLRIFRGADGAILYEDDEHGSHTRLEEAVIADVDNDGNAEVVIAGNRSRGGQPGVRVYQDAYDNWVRTRRVWNQHGYHITNVSESGRVPRQEDSNWTLRGLNSFRQNVQPTGLFNAPDLQADLEAQSWECPWAFHLAVTVRNEGSLSVPAGLSVSLYRGTPDVPGPELLATLQTTEALHVGGSEVFEPLRWPVPPGQEREAFDFFVRADDTGEGRGEHNECNEDNNVAALADTLCDNLCPPGVDVPTEERCNNVDDDCDGEVDEGLFRDCGTECGPGFERCERGEWVDCSAAEPVAEACNLVDDDCDGSTDEGNDLCQPSWACIEGVCRMPCQAGECPAGFRCDGGFCLPR